MHYLRESVEPGSLADWLRPPPVQHILNYKACHSAIRQVHNHAYLSLTNRSYRVELQVPCH